MKPNVLEMPIHCDELRVVVSFTAVDGLIVVRMDNEYVDTIAEEEIPALLNDFDYRLWEHELDPCGDEYPSWTAYDMTDKETEQTIILDLGRHLPAILEWARTQSALRLN